MRSTRRSARCCAAGESPADGFFLITSRCSFEMVVKAALFGADTLVSVSAPTSLALEKARAFGVTLIAVARSELGAGFQRHRGRGERRNGGVSGAKIDKLVRMANQIGDFYAAMPEKEGTQGAASHLRLYWTPKMIHEIVAFAEHGGQGLNSTAKRAVDSLKAAAA